jgi:DNA-binding protein HU-beta
MNKSQLIDAMAEKANLTKSEVRRALGAMIVVVKSALKKNESISLVGFGTFKVSKRAARQGRNPRTGALLKIKASRIARFRAGKALKDHLN